MAFCFCFLVGVGVWSLVYKKIDFSFALGSIFFFVFCFPIFWKKTRVRFFLLCFLFFILGIFRVSAQVPTHLPENISFYNEQKKEFFILVSEEPDVRLDGVKYIADVTEFTSGEKVNGKIFFEMPLYPRYTYGDVLKVNCGLSTPKASEDFRYDMYLAKFGVFSLCQHPKISFVDAKKGNFFYAYILDFKDGFAQKIQNLWHEPYASFVAGILYGYRGGLGTLQEDFNRTGVTHIVAVSGFNITLIASIFSNILLFFYIPRKKAFWIVLIAITVFVIFVGASGSVVRAGIMGMVVLLAQQLGRRSRALNSIICAVTLMVVHNPLVLLYDAGFQLSVVSTMGLVYLSPLIQQKLNFVPHTLGIQESLSSTLSAILATLPLILFQFGRLSLVAPLVNVLILPGIPIAMALGFASLVTSFISLKMSVIFSSLTFFVLAYITTIVRWFSSMPFASVEVSIPLWGMICMYAGIFYIYFQKKKLQI